MAPSHQPQVLFDALHCLEGFHDCEDEDSMVQANCLMKCRGEEEGDEDLSYLLRKEEQEIEPYDGFEANPSLGEARCEAVEWVLKVVDYYSFSAVTAVLAVNYLDRFLYGFRPDGGVKPWTTQLAAVACLSLAAKVEETDVPLLIDLQVEESKYVFEAKTIQRMEILVLSTLEWKMNPVTALAFLECIAKRLKFSVHFCEEILRRCDRLVLSVVSDCRFMCCLPSALATAVMVFAVSSIEPCVCVEYQDQLKGILGINNKDKVEDCCSLIQEVATSVNFYSSNKRKFGSRPGSPKGVVDVSFSFDSSNDSWGFSPLGSTSSSPVHLSKKIKSNSVF